ncbi:MAG: PhoD-like phosphatase N-terminal domain-containing protein, partial [Pseudomonadota bacterium]
MNRRNLLTGLTSAAVAAALARSMSAQPSFANDPFTLGVASGSPTANGVTLWTRLAPAPLEPAGGLDPVPYPLDWVVAQDDALQQIVASGTAIARPELAHSVRVQVGGLEPGRHYWYRFTTGGAESMSQAPYAVRNARWGTRLGKNLEMEDTLWSSLTDSYCGCPMA